MPGVNDEGDVLGQSDGHLFIASGAAVMNRAHR